MANNEDTIDTALDQARAACTTNMEEQGGVIVRKPEGIFKFIKIENAFAGQPQANTLWLADREEYAEKVIPLFNDGWKNYASYHTHPRWPAQPSSIDLKDLFPGFPVNYIHSSLEDETNRFELIDGQWSLVERRKISNEQKH